MAYFEPIYLQIDGAGEGVAPSADKKRMKITQWSDPHNYALNKILGTDFDAIDTEAIHEAIQTQVDEVFNPVSQIDSEIAERMSRLAVRGKGGRADGMLVLYNSKTVVIPSSTPGLLFLISEYKDDLQSAIDSFEGKLNNISQIASDFGMEMNLLWGEDLAQELSSGLQSDVTQRDEFDNSLEQSIHSDLSERLTRCMDANVTFRFGDDDPEVYEYDLLIHAGSSNRIVIEAKDASHDEADLGKSELISTPRDKSNIIGTSQPEEGPPWRNSDRTDIFVIVRQMSDEDFKEQKKMAQRRDIELLRYEDGEYIDSIEETLRNMVYSELVV